jgi:hypothetical protein
MRRGYEERRVRRLVAACGIAVMVHMATGGVFAAGNRPDESHQEYRKEIIVTLEPLDGKILAAREDKEKARYFDLDFKHHPYDIAVDNEGNVYVAFKRLSSVRKYDSKGRYLRNISWPKGDSRGLYWRIYVDRRHRLLAISDGNKGGERYDMVDQNGKVASRHVSGKRKGRVLSHIKKFIHGVFYDPDSDVSEDGWIGERKPADGTGHLWPEDVRIVASRQPGRRPSFALEVGGRSVTINEALRAVDVGGAYFSYIDGADNIYIRLFSTTSGCISGHSWLKRADITS